MSFSRPLPTPPEPRRKRGFCVSGVGNIREFPCATGVKFVKFGRGGPIAFAPKLASFVTLNSFQGPSSRTASAGMRGETTPASPELRAAVHGEKWALKRDQGDEARAISRCDCPPLKRSGFGFTLFTTPASRIIGLRHVPRTRPNPATYPPLGVSWRALPRRAAALRGSLATRQSDQPSFRK